MQLQQDDFKAIGDYIEGNLHKWLQREEVESPLKIYDVTLAERIVRVEEELKHQRELMMRGFEMMEKRFEQVDKRFELISADMNSRFEQVDKRFELMSADMNSRFEQMNRRLFQFMIWSFGFSAIAAGIIIAVLK